MLLEFTVGNFLSFKDKKTLSLEAASISDFPDNVFSIDKHKLLKTAAIYGANSSGKSNLLRALDTMRQIVLTSANQSSTAELPVTPFLLSTDTEGGASYFEIVFLLEGQRFRYGFEATSKKIVSEWLYEGTKTLFLRIEEGIEVKSKFKEGRDLEARTRDNALFLAVVDQFNGAISEKIMKWIYSLKILSGLFHEEEQFFTHILLTQPKSKLLITSILEKIDLGFLGIKVNVSPADSEKAKIDGNILNFETKTLHNKYDASGKIAGKVEFDLEKQESAGTNKLFDLVGIISFILETGGRLIVDELDAKLHPLLTLAILRLFNSTENNPNNAQLIFATHDTNLLSMGNLRRDQIYFTEKNQYEATDLYALVEYKDLGNGTVRKDRSFAKDYIQGRYGAIPFVGDFSKMTEAWQKK